MEQELNWQELLGKIEKIKNLSDRAGTAAEAEAAAAALSRLLVKYNLDMAEVSQRLGTIKRDEFETTKFDIEHAANWRRSLVNVVARNNFCRTYYVPRTSNVYIFGDPHNIILVKDLYMHLADVVDNVVDIEWKKFEAGYTTLRARAWKNSFREGMVWGIHTAMKRAKKAAADEVVGGSALVLVKDEEVDSAFNAKYNLGKGSRTRVSDSRAYNAGYQAGQNVSTNRPLGGGRS